MSLTFGFLAVAVCPLLLLLASEIESCQEDVRQVRSCNARVETLGDLYSRSRNFSANSTVCVDLRPNTTETLSYTNTPLNFSVVLMGSSNSTVTCDPSPNPDVDDLLRYTHFPLRFQNVSLVNITGVHFDGCKRPLQFEWVESIIISSSTFT